MFEYKKFLEKPIRIKKTNPRLANIIATQYGGAYCNFSVGWIPKNNPKYTSIFSCFYYFLNNGFQGDILFLI